MGVFKVRVPVEAPSTGMVRIDQGTKTGPRIFLKNQPRVQGTWGGGFGAWGFPVFGVLGPSGPGGLEVCLGVSRSNLSHPPALQS